MPRGNCCRIALHPDIALFDLTELALLGGKARSAAEYQALLETAGFTEVAVRPTEIDWSVIEPIRP